MAIRRTPVVVVVLLTAAALYLTWTIAGSVYQHIITGTVDSSVVFSHRIHTYVMDTQGTCNTPKWVGNHGTLITTADCSKEGWTVQKISNSEDVERTAGIAAHDLCARGNKMACLVVSNSKASSSKSLKNLVRLTLAKYANEDVAWSCGPGCNMIPAQFSYCIANEQFGGEGVPEGFSEDKYKCKLLQHEAVSL